MNRRFFVLATLLTLLVLLLGVPGTLAQGPEPPCPVKPPPGGGPYQTPDGLWVMPREATPFAGARSLAPQDTGGPDEFGYTWDDSVAFNWINATGGTNSGLTGDDEWTGPIDIGFNFKFYENTYSQLYFNTNGLVTFGAGAYHYSNQSIPNPGAPNDFIAPFWDDLCVSYGNYNTGAIYYLWGGSAPNRYFVIEWYAVSRLGSTDLLTFEAILYENGDVLTQYQSMAGYLDWATVGLEDSTGTDGLEYGNTVSNNKAIRFTRPDPSARVKMWPLYQGRFTHAGEAVAFQVPIRNTGELGGDTYDLTVSSPWSTALYAADGVTPLTDTDGDGTVDTGSVAQGGSATVVVEVTSPGAANVGDQNTAVVTARSSLNTGKSKAVSLQTAVPAAFAQVFRDDADGAMSLYLAQPGGQSVKKVTSDWYYGYHVAVAEMPSSFAYFWYKGRSEGDVYVGEIEYTLLDSAGNTTRAVSRLTDHTGATVRTYDYDPAVAVAPNGHIGVIWYRYLYNSSNYSRNYNIYYAILDAAGNVVVPPTNLTNNPYWGSG